MTATDAEDELLRTLLWLRNHYDTNRDDAAMKAKVLGIVDWVIERHGERLMIISLGRMKPVFDAYKQAHAPKEPEWNEPLPMLKKQPVKRRGIKGR